MAARSIRRRQISSVMVLMPGLRGYSSSGVESPLGGSWMRVPPTLLMFFTATPRLSPNVEKLVPPCCQDFFERVSKFLKPGDSVVARGIGW
jgi:hypothetical protein